MPAAVDVTQVARSTVDLVKEVGPVVLAAGLALSVAGLLRRAGRTELRLALRGLVGGRRPWPRQLVLGLAIPMLAVASLSVSLALEHELRNGPNRMVQRLAGPGAAHAQWLLQTGTNHFMNDSRLPAGLATDARRAPATVTVWSQLADVVDGAGHRSTSLVLARAGGTGDRGTPFAVVTATARCVLHDRGCAPGPGQAIVDADLASPGDVLHVRDHTLRVVANFAQPASLLNRAVVAVHDSAFDLPDGTRERPYAIIAPTAASAAALVRRIAGRPDRAAVQLRSTASIQAANATFWAGNGTPILLILILLIVAFGTIAYFTARRAAQEQAKPALATMLALGVMPGVLARAELARTLVSTLVAGAVALPLACAIVDLADSQILGFHAAVSLRMVLASMGMMVFVAAITALLLYSRVRTLEIAREMNA